MFWDAGLFRRMHISSWSPCGSRNISLEPDRLSMRWPSLVPPLGYTSDFTPSSYIYLRPIAVPKLWHGIIIIRQTVYPSTVKTRKHLRPLLWYVPIAKRKNKVLFSPGRPISISSTFSLPHGGKYFFSVFRPIEHWIQSPFSDICIVQFHEFLNSRWLDPNDHEICWKCRSTACISLTSRLVNLLCAKLTPKLHACEIKSTH